MRLSPLIVVMSAGMACTDHGLKIHEDPPTASILEPGDGDGFVAGTPVAFRVQLDDNDDGVDSLNVAWRSDTHGTLEGEAELDGSTQTFVTSDLNLGTHTVTVTATDPDGQTGEDTVEIQVRANSAPLIAIEYPSPDAEVAEGDDVLVSIRASDTEEEASSLRLVWTVDETPQIGAPENPDDLGQASISLSELAIGVHSVSVNVTDLAGLTTSDSIDFTVLENQPPTIAITSPTEGSISGVGDDVSVWVAVSDPEEAPETLVLSWTLDGIPQPDATDQASTDGTAHFLVEGPAEGEHNIAVSVADAFGGSSNASASFIVIERDADGDGFDAADVGGDDCDDSNEDIHPDADEICDDIDNDCDEHIDAADPELTGGYVGYLDNDGDGFGAGTDTVMVCDSATLSYTGGDCDDDNPDIHPDATEVCNGIDDNCDGEADETLLVTVYADEDGDGYGDDSDVYMGCDGEDGAAMVAGDCNDLDPYVNPDATEICGDGIDNDCDGGSGVCAWTGDTLVSSAEYSVYGDEGDDQIASSLAGDDVTGDGIADLIIGGSEVGISGDRTGGVYIMAGPLIESASSASDAADIMILGSQLNGLTGSAVATSDLNGDDQSDLLIASPDIGIFGTGEGAGEVSLFFGPLVDDADTDEADVIFEGTREGGHLGSALAGGGDLDGDGLPEMILSAANLNEHASNGGAIYVFGGDSAFDDEIISADDRDAKVYTHVANMKFGATLSFIGDANGDGRDDLLIGAPGARAHGTKTGAAFLMLGHATNFSTGTAMLHTSMDAWYDGAAERDEAGTAITGLGDVDGDGRTEFAIGAPKNNQNATNCGAAYLMLDPSVSGGAHDLTTEADVRYYGAESENRIGESLAGNIDLDNDSVLDLIIGGPNVDYSGSASRGKSYLFYGPITDLSDADLGSDPSVEDGTFLGNGIRDFAGQVALGGTDWTDDGITDLAISAPGNASITGTGDAGAVYVFYGRGM